MITCKFSSVIRIPVSSAAPRFAVFGISFPMMFFSGASTVRSLLQSGPGSDVGRGRRRRILQILLALTFSLALPYCGDPPVVEAYGMDGVESVNGFDLFEQAVSQDVDLQTKGFLEFGFFDERDVILYLDRSGRSSAFARLVPTLNELNNQREEFGEPTASLLILLRDSDASAEVWRKIAKDMPSDSKVEAFAEKITALELFSSYMQRLIYEPILGMRQARAPEEGNVPRALPVIAPGGFPMIDEANWKPLREWYPGLDLPEKWAAWNYFPHWRSRVSDRNAGESRFGALPDRLAIRRILKATDGSENQTQAEQQSENEESDDYSDYQRFRQGHRTIISVAGRPLLVRIQYGAVPVYIMSGSENFLNWHMARPEHVSFLTFLLHAVSEKPADGKPLKVTYVQRGLVPAGQVANREKSLVFLLAEEPWGLILLQFILVLVVFIWSRFPHERTPLEPQESGSRNFKEHFEALASRMVRSRKRIYGLASLSRWKKKKSIEAVFPELEQNVRINEDTILKRVRNLWE